MGEVVKLVPSPVSQDTVDELFALLQEARAGKIIGLTYVALHPGKEFTADVVGQSRKVPLFTLGTVQRLNQYLLDLHSSK